MTPKKERKVRQLASMGLHTRGGGWKDLDSKATAQKDGTALASRMLIGARFFLPPLSDLLFLGKWVEINSGRE